MIRQFIACFMGLVLVASSWELYFADHFLVTRLSWTNNSTQEQKRTATKESAVPWLDPMRHNRTYVFVHLGKAGGSTVFHATTTLQGACRQMGNKRRRQTCLYGIANQTRDEMIISQTGRIVTRLHGPEQKNMYNMRAAGAFLWPIRDPMDRLVSAFYFHHPENNHGGCRAANTKTNGVLWSLWCSCFDHVEELILELEEKNEESKIVFPYTASPTPDHNYTCQEMARLAVTEHSPRWGHMTMNYRYYYQRTLAKFPHKDVVALRTEHLWDDLQLLEYWMGGNATVGPDSTRKVVSHGSEHFRYKSKLTDPNKL